MDGKEQVYFDEIKQRLRQQAEPDLDAATNDVREKMKLLDALDEEILERARAALEQETSERVSRIQDPYVLSKTKSKWYDESQVEGIHWPALSKYLVDTKGWPEKVVAESISPYSAEVVSELGNPAEHEFNVRGLVVGHVQSGKTANMTAVIARAVDAGYNLVVVMAGITDKLRHQTQARLEDDLYARNPFNWQLLTKRNTYHADGRLDVKGEYRTQTDRQLPKVGADVAMLAIVKKNSRILERLINDISNSLPERKNRLRMLVIDDEADQASPNTGKHAEDPTITNRRIRQLLRTLPAVSYIGYTATPFANTLINPWPVNVIREADGGKPKSEDELYEKLEDLYPRDFILSLPQPDAYFGAEQIFGRDAVDAEDESADGIDVIREVEPDEVRLLTAGDDVTIEDIPSLRRAIRWFVLTIAGRLARGQIDQHQSMLVHTSHRIDDHSGVQGLVEQELSSIKSRISDPALLNELETLWRDETAKVSTDEFANSPLDFKDVSRHLIDAMERLDVAVENSKSDDRLSYEGPPGAVIAIGGNILSRGLTLEGLTVTYFTRNSRQYDTLLQMGRWFGYREGYEDLIRLWMPPTVSASFRQLALVEHELREEIAEYSERSATPLDFAVRIRTLPGLQVTAPNKMKGAKTVAIDYRGLHLQTIRFPRLERETLEKNWAAGAKLTKAAGIADGSLIGTADASSVIQFLREYEVHPSHRDLRTDWLEQYVARNRSTLEEWSIAVFQTNDQKRPLAPEPLGPLTPRLLRRSRLKTENASIANIKGLMSRRDVMFDVPATRIPDSPGWENWAWSRLKKEREEILGSRPMLLLYPIDRNSQPLEPGKERVALDAAYDVLGIGVVFPQLGVSANKQPTRYISVDLGDEGYEDENSEPEGSTGGD